jgi:putative ABC transport system substrate-binding protein
MTPIIGRREVLTGIGGALAWPLMARAQQGSRMRRIGALMSIADDAEGQARVVVFQKSLANLGWTAGNLHVDYRWSDGDATRVRVNATKLVRLNPEVILAAGTAALRALHQETRTLPIVFVAVSDPVPEFIPSFAHPGGNLTGLTNIESSMGSKWVELLKQIAPQLTRMTLMFNPATNDGTFYRAAFEEAGIVHGVQTNRIAIRNAAEIASAIDDLGSMPNVGLLVPPDPLAVTQHELIVALAARYRIPAIYPDRTFATAGGLMSYGLDSLEGFRGAASYVDRILRGAKAGDLPVQRPNKFEMVVNLKTAKALGIEVPDMLVALADEVIE